MPVVLVLITPIRDFFSRIGCLFGRPTTAQEDPEEDPAEFPPYPVDGQNMYCSPWNLSLYNMISLQLYHQPDIVTAITFKDLVVSGYKNALSDLLPAFDGFGDVNVFLDQIELCAALQNWTCIRPQMLHQLLKGSALEWYTLSFGHLAWDEQLPWMELRKCMQLAFPPQWSTSDLICKLDSRRQGPLERMQHYIISVLSLCRQCDQSMDEETMVLFIQVGLNARYRRMIDTSVKCRLAELWDSLLLLECYYPAHSTLKSSKLIPVEERYSGNIICPECRLRGIYQLNCSKTTHRIGHQKSRRRKKFTKSVQFTD